jgi:hydrogenase maturation factor
MCVSTASTTHLLHNPGRHVSSFPFHQLDPFLTSQNPNPLLFTFTLLTMSDNTRPPPQPSSLITQRSCADFQDLESFKDCLASIAQVKEHHEFVLLDIPRDWADIVFEVLDEVVSAR